ncbi:MAG: pyridoxal phosphate-dependent aminotransferase [Ruminococcaceae bacterium]|nr:pyridoxal phosphate-dependent aminotransferase [Oscillospiraceae bacterium]
MYLSEKFQSISPSPTLAIDAKFKQMKADGLDVVGFGAGEPDFDTPRHIKDAAIEAINAGMTKYTPASGTMELKQAVCDKLKADNGLDYQPNQIVISNGAKHSLMNAFGAILNPGDEVIVPAPFWVSYTEMIRLNDGIPVIVDTTEENGFKFTIDQLVSAITPKTRAILINSPSNPTGMLYTKEELQAVADLAVEKNLYVISDEIYEHLIYGGEKHVSIASLGDKIKDLTIIINGVSKTYAMTGWRIGYTASNAQIAKVMGSVQSHATSNPNSIAQRASYAALTGPKDEIEEMRATFEERRCYMVERMNSIDGVSCLMPQGAFYVMMNISALMGKTLYGTTITDADVFANLFLEKAKVAVVPGTGFAAPNYVRWSYATSMENIKEGLDRLERFLQEK